MSLEHESSIYVLSQLRPDETDEIVQVLTASSTRLSEVEHLSWTISNRYYTSTVQFLLTDSPEHLLVKISDGAPAVLLLIDSAQSAPETLLERFDSDAIDVPLVAGYAREATISSERGASSEDLAESCVSRGWEYIDLGPPPAVESADDDEASSSNPSGYERLAEALQARMWPHSTMNPQKQTLRERLAKSLSEAGENDEGGPGDPLESAKVAPAVVSKEAPAAKTDSATPTGFEDDFSPFVAADSPVGIHTITSFSDSLEEDNNVLGLGHDDQDPTAHLTSLFASLAGLREQAMAIQDDDERKDFAAKIALDFARQLDALAAEDGRTSDGGAEEGEESSA